MKTAFVLHAILGMFALVPVVSGQDTPPSDAQKIAEAQVDAYVAAFNRGDADAVAEMYAEDAQYTTEEGGALSGREEIARNLKEYFAGNEGAELAVRIQSARFLTPDVLIEKGVAFLGGETTHYVCNYVKKDGGWQISDLNETTLPPEDVSREALDELSWMVGSWKDNTPGVSVATTVDWTKNHHFIRRSVTINREDEENSMEATEVIGYDPVAEGIRSWVFDSEGGFGEGTWTRDANKWLVAFTATAPDGTISSAQHVITYVDDNKYTWESINRQSEGEVLPNIEKIEVVRTETK